MPLKPHMKDPNRDKEMRRFNEDPGSFGIGGARTKNQRELEKELAEKQEAEMLAKEEARVAEIASLNEALIQIKPGSKEAKELAAKIAVLEEG